MGVSSDGLRSWSVPDSAETPSPWAFGPLDFRFGATWSRDLLSGFIRPLGIQRLNETTLSSELLRRVAPCDWPRSSKSAFGRQKLDEMLLEAIPDNDFRPGRLHRLLLDLPWVDVLTTNYDTLLEQVRTDAH